MRGMAAHAVRGVSSRDDHGVELLHVHLLDGFIHGHGVTVLAVVFLGVAGAHHHCFGPLFFKPQQGIPEFQVFIEIFGKNRHAFALQTFFQWHGSASL